jgi:hypothetical protein
MVTGDFEVENGRVTVTAEVFACDPVNLIRLFWVADRKASRSIQTRLPARHKGTQTYRCEAARQP